MSWKRQLLKIATSILTCFVITAVLCSFDSPTSAVHCPAHDAADTLPKVSAEKIVKLVSYAKHLNKFKVQYSDGFTETITRQQLDERGIYYPGHPEISDSAFIANKIDPNIPINDAVVDKDLLQKHLDINLENYIEYALSKGLKRGAYTSTVRFLINEDGSLSDFTASPEPGYNFLKFIEAIFKTGPKWKPANQNGKAVRSVYSQQVKFSIVRASMLLE